MNRNIYKLSSISMALFIALILASCYKFGRIAMPTEVKGNEAYNSRVTAINDGGNGYQTGLSFFGIRVPQNWNVTVGEESYVQYAQEGIMDDRGNPVNLKAAMRYCAELTDMLNKSNPKEGYTWFAFQTKECIYRSIQGSGSNAADSICIDYTVINDGVAGTYELDFMLGSYETSDPNVLANEFIGRDNDVQGSDIYRVGTEQVINGTGTFNNVMTDYKRTIKVLEGGTPVDNTPKLTATVDGNSVNIEYANMIGNIEIFKNASTVGINADHTVAGDQKYNNGSYSLDITDYEPGTYHVRSMNTTAETTFHIANKEFAPKGTPVVVLGTLGLLSAENIVKAGKALEVDRAGDANLYDMSETIIKAVFDSILQIKPEIVLIPGDLTMNGDKKSHEVVVEMLNTLSTAGIKTLVVSGDKDINNPNACKYEDDIKTPIDNITAEDFTTLYAAFGYSDAVSRDETTLSYMSYPTDKFAILAIDACQYKNNSNSIVNEDGTVSTNLDSTGKITMATLDWMRTAITEARNTGRKVIAMAHHQIGAPFNGYESLGNIMNNTEGLDLSGMLGGGNTENPEGGSDVVEPVADEESDTEELSAKSIRDVLAFYGVEAIFVGDSNATDITRMPTVADINLYQIATGAAIAYGCPFRLVDITDEGIDIQTRLNNNINEDDSFEAYAYYRTKEMLPTLVNTYVTENWEFIDSFLKSYFVFEYNPETDAFNKNDFMKLPATPEEMATLINTNVIPPLVDVILAYADGNEHMKKSEQLVTGMQNGVTGVIDGLNTLPAIVTPLIKDGFLNAGLDLDAMVTNVVSSIAYNYAGTPDNTTNDLFFNIPFTYNAETAIEKTENTSGEKKVVGIYNIDGTKANNMKANGIYIQKMSDGTSRKVIK